MVFMYIISFRKQERKSDAKYFALKNVGGRNKKIK